MTNLASSSDGETQKLKTDLQEFAVNSDGKIAMSCKHDAFLTPAGIRGAAGEMMGHNESIFKPLKCFAKEGMKDLKHSGKNSQKQETAAEAPNQ